MIQDHHLNNRLEVVGIHPSCQEVMEDLLQLMDNQAKVEAPQEYQSSLSTPMDNPLQSLFLLVDLKLLDQMASQ